MRKQAKIGEVSICEKRREDVRARNLYEKSIASILPAATDRAARRSLAKLAKRQGDFELACQLWQDALGNSRHGYEAYEQLAIYYEGKARDFERARKVVEKALDQLRRAMQTGDIALSAYHEIKAKFDHRLKRLERKSRQTVFDAVAVEAELIDGAKKASALTTVVKNAD
jgi:tetratricopeptide (TPR) repeat protein